MLTIILGCLGLISLGAVIGFMTCAILSANKIDESYQEGYLNALKYKRIDLEG